VNQTPDSKIIRSLLHEFIAGRLQTKIEKLKPDEHEAQAKLNADHQPGPWLEDAARRASQIQLASHTLKAIHPDARGSVVNLRSPICTDDQLIGTHTLVAQTPDVVGNAAALDVFKLLKIEHAGKSVLERLLADDVDMLAALSDDASIATALAKQLSAVADAGSVVSSHTLAKQLYFPLDNGEYHLLAPLFPTALVHAWHNTLKNDRWSDETTAARKAFKEEKSYPHGYRDFRNLAFQRFGGSNKQNISQLNSERDGKAYLLNSQPPNWVSREVRPPRGESIFDGAFPNRQRVKELTKLLRDYLFDNRSKSITLADGEQVMKAGPNNRYIRGHRAELVQEIIDELLTYVAQIYTLDPGWSLKRDCTLGPAQRLLFDPYAEHDAQEHMTSRELGDRVANDFALWLNSAIRTDETAMGDDERIEWKHELKPQLIELATDLEAMRDGN
jgi:CRISPR-associated protein Csy1